MIGHWTRPEKEVSSLELWARLPHTSEGVQNSVTVPYSMFRWLKKSTAEISASAVACSFDQDELTMHG